MSGAEADSCIAAKSVNGEVSAVRLCKAYHKLSQHGCNNLYAGHVLGESCLL